MFKWDRFSKALTLWLLALIWPGIVVNSGVAAGASLILTPASGFYSVGSEIVAEIRVNTGGQNATAVAANLVYDETRLQVVAVDSTNSAFSVQAEQTVNGNQIKIVRGQPAPGVNSANALIAKLRFKAKMAGTALIRFNLDATGPGQSRIILGDGQGTDVLSGVVNTTYEIQAVAVVVPKATPPAQPETPTAKLPATPPTAPLPEGTASGGEAGGEIGVGGDELARSEVTMETDQETGANPLLEEKAGKEDKMTATAIGLAIIWLLALVVTLTALVVMILRILSRGRR